MTSEVRERMVAAAARLLAERGYQGTSFGAVLEASGSPRGSIYHHFPDGKDQMIAAAIEHAGSRAVEAVRALSGLPAAEVVDGFFALWRAVLTHTRLTAGCSVLAVTVSAESDDLVVRAGDVFRRWRDVLADALAAGGAPAGDAADLAATVVAAAEGAVVLSRSEHDLAPFEAVARRMHALVAAT